MAYTIELPAKGNVIRLVAPTKAELIESIKDVGKATNLSFGKTKRLEGKRWVALATIPEPKESK